MSVFLVLKLAMTTFYLIRHGQSEKNAGLETRSGVNGQSSLTPLGTNQTLQLKKDLANINFDLTYSSPKSRALQTAELFAKTEIYQDDRLVEIDKIQDPITGLPRILSFLLEISQKYPQKNIAVFSHGRLIRTLLVHLGYTTLDLSPGGSFKNCGYVILDVTNKNIRINNVIGLQQSS